MKRILLFMVMVMAAMTAMSQTKSQNSVMPGYSDLVSGLTIYKLDDKTPNYVNGYVSTYDYPAFNKFIKAIEKNETDGKIAVLMRIYDEDSRMPKPMAQLTATGFNFVNLYTSNQKVPKALINKNLSIYNVLIPMRNIDHTQDGNDNSVYSIKCSKEKAQEIVSHKESMFLLLIMKPSFVIGLSEIKGYNAFNCVNLLGMYIVNLSENKTILNLNSCIRKLAPTEKRQIITVLNQEYAREQARSKPLQPKGRRRCPACNGSGKQIGDWSCNSCGGKGYVPVY